MEQLRHARRIDFAMVSRFLEGGSPPHPVILTEGWHMVQRDERPLALDRTHDFLWRTPDTSGAEIAEEKREQKLEWIGCLARLISCVIVGLVLAYIVKHFT